MLMLMVAVQFGFCWLSGILRGVGGVDMCSGIGGGGRGRVGIGFGYKGCDEVSELTCSGFFSQWQGVKTESSCTRTSQRLQKLRT